VELEAWSDDPHASEHTAAPADLARFDGVLLAGAGRRLPDMVLDAMAAGLPVIASAITAARHPLLSGDTGWIVSCSAADPGFAEACATAVAELYADADSRHSKGRQARSAVEDRHRPDAFLQTLGELFANGAPA
jgi:glycosyltransferase involved in cell wall biosynthesis